jgi:heme oxygenase (mycobilin-producing)
MAVKILIYRKIRQSKEKELSEAVGNVRSQAIHAEGYISGETLRSIEDPSVHLVISTWKLKTGITGLIPQSGKHFRKR